jgi:hypothetical protein
LLTLRNTKPSSKVLRQILFRNYGNRGKRDLNVELGSISNTAWFNGDLYLKSRVGAQWMKKLLRGNIRDKERFLLNHLKGFLQKAGQGDQIANVGNKEFDHKLRVIK